MVLTAYFDESGTHGGAELSVMAGFVGEARQWRKFESRTSKLFRRFGVDIFHSIDVKRTDKDFSGWRVDRKIEFLDEFKHIIYGTLERGFASILKEEDYLYYSNLAWSARTRKDSRYGLLFRASLASATEAAIAVPRWAYNEPRLRVVLESGHRNESDALRLYEFFKEKFGDQAKPLAGLNFATKQACLPLAAADLFAYSAYREEVGRKPIGIPRRATESDASYKGNAYRIVIDRETLEALHQQEIIIASEQSSPFGGQRS